MIAEIAASPEGRAELHIADVPVRPADLAVADDGVVIVPEGRVEAVLWRVCRGAIPGS